ncbi:MAG: nitrile hydratase subunit alpha [Chloroflexota bacterium]|nr:nitrile hydratase subunit alpha [Chloroflexota bacterium]
MRVIDSSADYRYLILPKRPAGTEGMTEEQLAKLITQESMIGVGLALSPEAVKAS